MSLKYRLIILTIAVFAMTFGLGTLMGVHASRRLAEVQLVSHLQRSAQALAASSAPLNDEVLTRMCPLLDAQVMVLDAEGKLQASSRADWDWDKVRAAVVEMERSGATDRATSGKPRCFFAVAAGRIAATGQSVRVYALTEQAAVEQPMRAILRSYLGVLAATSILLAVGMYVVGLRLVGRINRLHRQVDQTLSDEPGGATGGGAGVSPVGPARRAGPRDELKALLAAFDDLLGRLQRSRQRLAAQQRLATTGKLASSIAHEVRNPLQAIRLIVQMFREKARPEDRQGCDLVLGEIDRLSLLTDELLVLAGKDALRVEPVDLVRELHETVRLLQFQLRQRDIRMEIDLPPLPPVTMDRNRCRQLLLNLLLNASEASPRGGVLRATAQGDGNRVTLRIADGGPGFPPEVLAGTAEEFFSTKSSGAGLGLSICRRIVLEAGGQLNLSNAPGGGAVAEVTLNCRSPIAN